MEDLIREHTKTMRKARDDMIMNWFIETGTPINTKVYAVTFDPPAEWFGPLGHNMGSLYAAIVRSVPVGKRTYPVKLFVVKSKLNA